MNQILTTDYKTLTFGTPGTIGSSSVQFHHEWKSLEINKSYKCNFIHYDETPFNREVNFISDCYMVVIP